MIEEDIKTTLPTLHVFMPGTGPMYQDLKDMLCAWVVSRSDEGLGYVYGIAKIAAMILLNMAAPQGFVVMRNLLERHCMRSFYGGLTSKDDVGLTLPLFYLHSLIFNTAGRSVLQVACISLALPPSLTPVQDL